MRALSSLADDDRKIEGAILTTYPFDTEFYEGAVRRIVSRKKGVGSDNVILVDSSKYRETFKRDVKPRYAGRRYYLSPVSVDGKRVFHPKMFFFAGQKRAYCFVGSANLTQRGLTHNAELWSHFASERKEEGEESTQRQSLILRDLREFLLDLFDTQYTDMIGQDAIKSASETLNSCDWLRDKAKKAGSGVNRRTHVIHNLERSILGQVFEYIDTEVEKVSVVAPYFGETSRVLEEIRDKAKGEFEIEIYLQQDEAQFDIEELEKWLSEGQSSLRIFKNSRFVHGKMLQVDTEDQSLCLTGSPNPSVKGMLTSTENGGNVELGILRRHKQPRYFRSMLKDDIVGEVIGDTPDEFRPSLEAPVEDKITSESASEQELVLVDAVYSDESTLRGDTLEVRVSGVSDEELDSGKVVVRSETGSGSLEIGADEGEVNRDDSGVVSVELRVDSDEDIFSSTCRVVFKLDEKTSSPRWLVHESSDIDEQVRQEAEEGGTANTPDQVYDLFVSEGERQSEILHAVGSIVEGIDVVMAGKDGDAGGQRGGSGGVGGELPPDWKSDSPSDVRIDEVIDGLYTKWVAQTRKLAKDATDEMGVEALCQDFSRLIAATNRTTLHLLTVGNHMERQHGELSPEDLVDWKAYRDMYYAKDGATLEDFRSQLTQREANVETEDGGEEISKLLHENILPQVVLTYLITENEEAGSRFRQQHHLSWTYSAAINCLSRGYPQPEYCTPESVSRIKNSVRDTIEEVLEKYDEGTEEIIRSKYLENNAVRYAILEVYASSIIESGPQSLRRFYDALYNEISEDEEFLEEIKSIAPRLSGVISRRLNEMNETDSQRFDEYISVLDEVEKKWEREIRSDYDILKYARPGDVY